MWINLEPCCHTGKTGPCVKAIVDSGIKDTLYYWGEFQKALKLYIELKKESVILNSFNLGGGFPIRNHLGFEYNYEYMINEIIANIKDACTK